MQEIKHITPYRQELPERILEAAMQLFITNGIKSVKMDDIASCIGISKRTLYEVFQNKEVLLYEGVKKYHKLRKEKMHLLAESSRNVIDILLKVYEQKADESRLINPVFYSDIEKYPEVMKYLKEQDATSHEVFMEYFRRGVEEGYFRNDLNIALISTLLDAIGKHIMSAKLYFSYSVEDIINNLLFVSIRGLCTQKGIRELDEFLSSRKAK